MAKADAEVKVDVDGTVDVEVTGTNTGNFTNEFAVGLSIVKPSGTIVDLPPKTSSKAAPGDKFTVKWTDIATGCVRSSNGKEEGVALFDEKGMHDVMTRIYGGVEDQAGECFGKSLQNPVTDPITIEDAVNVQQLKDGGIPRELIAGAGAVGLGLIGVALADR